VDPGIFERQITQESGFDPKAVSPAGAQGIAQFMPATAKGVGLADPFDPYAALEAAARHMRDNLAANGGDYARALAAYNAGAGAVQKYGGVPPFPETQQYVRTILGPGPAPTPPAKAAPAPATAAAAGIPMPGSPSAPAPHPSTYVVENQLEAGKQAGLTTEQALAICGPVAATAFARANGRNPTVGEAVDLAQKLGLFDYSVGMHGPQAEVALLKGLGVDARLQQGADEAAIASEVQAGRPAVIDLPGHYLYANGYDPATRQFDFGESARVLKASGGRSRYRLDELASLGMGAPRASIFLQGAR
jgi:hypothetical protein